jgi:hypothetical protein
VFDSRRYQIFFEVVGLERGPLSLVLVTEELLEWTTSGSGSRKSRLTAVGTRRSVGLVRLRTKATEFRSVDTVSRSNAFGNTCTVNK